MKVTPITNPLPGERVVAVWPRMAIQVDAGWNRRLNLYTGRTLSDSALAAEQAGRSGRLVSLAQMLSPGVATGLEVDVDVEPGAIPPASWGQGQFLVVSSGVGITAWGEDVIVPHDSRVALTDLVSEEQQVTQTVGVLVLEPVKVRQAGRFDETDPCDVDESDDAFFDEQDVDGCRLLFLPWQAEWGAVPITTALTWRNQVAHFVFGLEQALPFGEVLPWETRGVPIAMVGLNTTGFEWVDRFSVVRAGGHAKTRAPLVPGAGTSSLWQARLRQFVDQISEQATVPAALRIQAYAKLPPVGMLPRDAVDLAARTNTFFPPSWAVRAVPLPLEQLDQVVENAISLAPMATDGGERAIVLVPVPQSVYEPGLLVDDVVDGIFQHRIDQFVAERDNARKVRMAVRRDFRALVQAVDGAAAVPKFSDFDAGTPPDADALPDESPVTAGTNPETSGGRFGVTGGDGTPPSPLTVKALTDLRETLRHKDAANVEHPLFSATELADFDGAAGLAAFVDTMKKKLAQADDAIDLSFLKSHPNIYRIRQQLLGSTASTRLATSPVLASIAKGDSAETVADEVNRYFFAVKKTPPGTVPPAGGAGGKAVIADAGAAPGVATPASAGTPVVADMAFTAAAGDLFGGSNRLLPAPGLGTAIDSKLFVSTAKLVAKDTGGTLLLTQGGFERNVFGEVTRDPTVVLPPPSRSTVQRAAPVAGEGAYDFRTVSIAQRIEDPPSKEAKAYAVAARAEVLNNLEVLRGLGMNVDGITVFGVPFFDNANVPQYYKKFLSPKGDEIDEPPAGTTPIANPRAVFPRRVAVSYGSLRAAGIGALLRDPPPTDGDEASFFSEAVIVIEHMIATLRAIEGLVASYKAEVALCDATLTQLGDAKASASSRLTELDNSIIEARHKVATARALLTDEQLRVKAINDRRKEVLREHVRFLAYVRPIYVEARVGTPALHLDPGLFEAPVPACMAAHDDVPPELEQMVQLLRESPVAWFTNVPQLLNKLDRVELLHGTLQIAKQRALTVQEINTVATTFVQSAPTGRFGPAIAKVTAAQQRVVTDFRLQVASLDLARFAGRGWQETKDEAVHILSLGDLIESNHGRSAVADAATRELADITRIAACVHAQACQVLPVIRLSWAERLSQYDKSVSLRDLSVLPRWGEIDFVLRKEIQTLADWLYSRIAADQSEGVSWMHDLVRVCLLLASHAPVNEIIAGHVPVPTPATPGRTVPVAIDPGKVRLGMKVFFYKKDAIVAHGVVEDLVADQARARIAETVADEVTLDTGTRARFVGAESPDLPTFFRKRV